MYKKLSIRLSVDFSAEILPARRQRDDIFEVLKVPYLAKLLFKNESKIKTSPDK